MQKGIPTAPPEQNPSQSQVQQLIALYSEGRLQETLTQILSLLPQFPNSSFLYNIQGAAQVGLGELDAAVVSYKQAIRIEPGDAKIYFNLGIALNDKGSFAAAIDSYRQAIELNPDYAAAYNNMANTLRDEGELSLAIDCYRQALQVDPSYAEVYTNLGNALKVRGDLGGAVASYRRAIELIPDYAEAYSNMGSALKDMGDMEQASSCYRQALSIQPDYADAAWNMIGTATNIDAASAWVRRCLAIDPEHLSAKLALCGLEYFAGNRESFDELMGTSLAEHPTMRSVDWVSKLPALPELHFSRWAFFDSMAGRVSSDRAFYEFGVFTGEAFRYLMRTFDRGFGFDTFEGLPEDWHDEKAGSYSSEGNIPVIEGGEFIVGKFEDTLPGFFSAARPVAALINLDADLYSSTLCALECAKPVIDSETILIFDEFLMNERWEQDECRALDEFCSANGYGFTVLAVSFFTKQVSVRLTGI